MNPHKPAVRTLLEEYARIAQVNPRSRDNDQTESLRFYHAELAVTRKPHEHADSTDHVVRWILNIHSVEAFTSQHGDLPRENNRAAKSLVAPESKRLARWLRYQRHAVRAGDLRSTYQTRRLECLPGFTATPPDDGWDSQFAAYVRFVEGHGHAPRERSGDVREARSARWAVRQRLLYRRGTYDTGRAKALARLSSWTWD